MKSIVLYIALISSLFSFAQDINQLDANGKRHGKWQKTFEGTNELRYQGQFQHGKEVGIFKYYKLVRKKSTLAATKEFNAENDLAKTKFYTSRGKLISEGLMNGKKYIGEWKYYHRDGKTPMNIEHYNDKGLLHGKKQVFYETGQLAEDVNYTNGKLDGEAKYYAQNGTLIKHYTFINDKLHGYAKHFNTQGQLEVEGAYKNDKKHGIWKYYENGVLTKTKDFTIYSKNPYKNKKKN